MKILHVLDHSIPLHSGYTFRTLAILREQRARGWETYHLTSSKHRGAQSDIENVNGVEFYRTRPDETAWRRAPLIGQVAAISDTSRRLAEIVHRVRPDIIHAHSPALNAAAAIRVGRAARIPVVYEVRAFWEDAAADHGTAREGGARYRLSRALETWVMNRAQAVTTICEGLRADIVGRGVAADRVEVIPNAVDVDRFPIINGADESLKKQLGLSDGLVLGFLGSFYGYEGLDLLVAAMPRLLGSTPGIRLVLVGGGPEESSLRDQIASLGLGDKVLMTGRVPHADVARYYSVVDLLVFPRKSMRLTELVTPLKPLEAMAQGRLLLASNVGGQRELIVDNETGYLFKPDSSDAIVNGVLRAIGERDQWLRIIRRGRKFVEEERTWRGSVARYERVYAIAMQQMAQ